MSLVLHPEGPLQGDAVAESSALKVYPSRARPGSLSVVLLAADGSGPVRGGLRLDRDQATALWAYLDAWIAGEEALDV